MSAFLADTGLPAQSVRDPVHMVNAQFDAFGAATRGFSSIADGLRAVDVSTPFGEAQGAMPGSETEQAALWLGSRLAAMVQVYADDVAGLGDLARATGGTYLDTDIVQAQQFQQVTR